MKSKIVGALSVAVALAITTGCATKLYGTVLPQSGGNYKIITKGKEESHALKMAEHDAEAVCKDRAKKKQYEVVDHKVEYVGPKVGGAGDAGMAGMAASALQFMGQQNSKENYKVEMVVKCF